MPGPIEHIERIIEVTRQLLACTDLGDLERSDDRSAVFYAIVRDNAYKILHEAEKERLRQIDRGFYNNPDRWSTKLHDTKRYKNYL